MERIFAEMGVRMITGGTSNHLLLLDVWESFGVTGKEAEEALDNVRITLNKNVIADDTRSSLDPSGIRLGTPAITSRGFTWEECEVLAECIVRVLKSIKDKKNQSIDNETIRRQICKMAIAHPIPESY